MLTNIKNITIGDIYVDLNEFVNKEYFNLNNHLKVGTEESRLSFANPWEGLTWNQVKYISTDATLEFPKQEGGNLPTSYIGGTIEYIGCDRPSSPLPELTIRGLRLDRGEGFKIHFNQQINKELKVKMNFGIEGPLSNALVIKAIYNDTTTAIKYISVESLGEIDIIVDLSNFIENKKAISEISIQREANCGSNIYITSVLSKTNEQLVFDKKYIFKNNNWRVDEGGSGNYATVEYVDNSITVEDISIKNWIINKDYASNTSLNEVSTYTLNNVGTSLVMSLDPSTYVLDVSLLNSKGNALSHCEIDLPLELLIVDGYYDKITKEIVFVLKNGQIIRIPIADLVSDLQPKITETNKLSATLVDGLSAVATSGNYDDLNNTPTASSIWIEI